MLEELFVIRKRVQVGYEESGNDEDSCESLKK